MKTLGTKPVLLPSQDDLAAVFAACATPRELLLVGLLIAHWGLADLSALETAQVRADAAVGYRIVAQHPDDKYGSILPLGLGDAMSAWLAQRSAAMAAGPKLFPGLTQASLEQLLRDVGRRAGTTAVTLEALEELTRQSANAMADAIWDDAVRSGRVEEWRRKEAGRKPS